MDERKFQYKSWGDLCCAPPCSIQAKVLGPQLGNVCQPTLGGPVNNGLSQEQVVVTWNSERRVCISGHVYTCVCDRETERERLVYLPSGAPGQSQVRRKLECAVSISSLTGPSPGSKRFLERTPWFLAMPLVMAHTNFESVKWAITRCAAAPLKVDWPKMRSAGQVKFIYRTSSTNRFFYGKQGTPLCVCVCVCVCVFIGQWFYEMTKQDLCFWKYQQKREMNDKPAAESRGRLWVLLNKINWF